MDKIFYNGRIRTMDCALPIAQAVAVKNGVILRVGTNDAVKRLKTQETELIDLKGKLMLPGFHDSHIHLLSYGLSLEKVNLGQAKSIDDLIKLGREFMEKKDFSQNIWIQGRGWNNDDWQDHRFPTKYDLDRITTEYPVTYTRTCGHIIIVNSKALELIGITRDTPQIEGGKFDVDQEGEPLGIFREAARNLVYNAIPKLTVPDIKRLLVKGANAMLPYGLTALQSDDLEAVAEDEYQNVLDALFELSEAGELPLRIFEQCFLPPISRFREFLKKGYRTGMGNELFRIGPLKLLGDGSLGGRTAYLSKPYADDPTTRGIHVFTQEELDELIRTAHDHDMPVAVHCIGDGTMYMAMESIEKAMMGNPKTDLRHSIVHCQITDQTLLEKFRELNVIAHIQPIFIDYDMTIVKDRVGEGMEKTSYNWKTMLDLGVHVACGSDSPVESFDVLKNIYCAVTRKGVSSGKPEGGWLPDQKLTVEEAVAGFTTGGAYASYDERINGTISVGKQADFAVVDRDIFTLDPEELKVAKVTMTILGGNIVYSCQEN